MWYLALGCRLLGDFIFDFADCDSMEAAYEMRSLHAFMSTSSS